MSPIPVLAAPILNRPDLLDAMLASIDHPVDRIVVIDNGDVVSRRDVRVIAPGWNLGVAASWNLVIKANPLAPWWLIVNSDITFGPGDLARLEATVDPDRAAIYMMLGFAAFAITRHTVNAVGMFDEGFVVAYNEDVDYSRRADLAGVPRIEVGFSGTHVGSATIYSDPLLRQWNGASHAANDAYYASKWGGHKQGGETLPTPFNRGGHVGDWRFDLERIRANTWPRR